MVAPQVRVMFCDGTTATHNRNSPLPTHTPRPSPSLSHQDVIDVVPVVPEARHTNAPGNGDHHQPPQDEYALQHLTQQAPPTALVAAHEAPQVRHALAPVQGVNQVQDGEPAYIRMWWWWCRAGRAE